MNSLWLEHRAPMDSDPFEPNGTCDVAVIGAGLTGLTTALLLRRAGLDVTVIEARSIGAVTTGNTTAKLSLLQGSVLSQMRQHFPQEVVNAYVASNLEGQAWLLRYLEERSVAVQRRDAYTYATTQAGLRRIEREADVARNAGLDVAWVGNSLGLPFPTQAAIRLQDQAQFNPMDVVDELASDLRRRGGRIVEGLRVRKVSAGVLPTVHTDQGNLRAQHVVLATGVPILDRGLYFAKMSHSRSYVTANRLPADASDMPHGMYLSADRPARSLRTAPHGNGELLLVGGNDHPVGKPISELRQFQDLEEWVQRHYPGAETTHRWSAQDYRSANMVPFVGHLPRGGGNIHIATGYNKWGMANAVAAALRLSSDILGGSIAWAETISHRITGPRDLFEGAKINAGVAGKMLTGWTGVLLDGRGPARPAPDGSPESFPEEGKGRVLRRGRRPVAVSTDRGATCKVSAVCTHLGGILSWNDAERSWDCPLHGSRFSPTGQVLEGPATRDLKPEGREASPNDTKQP